MPFTVVSLVFSIVLKTTVQDSAEYLSSLPGIFPDSSPACWTAKSSVLHADFWLEAGPLWPAEGQFPQLCPSSLCARGTTWGIVPLAGLVIRAQPGASTVSILSVSGKRKNVYKIHLLLFLKLELISCDKLKKVDTSECIWEYECS